MVLERMEHKKHYYHGAGGYWIDDDRWGWKPAPGAFQMGTSEFEVTGDVNEMFMNDDPVKVEADLATTRIMVLGDSHTFAVGVSRKDNWPSMLEDSLNEAHPERFRVYNAATTGYNLHQHLLRLMDQGPTLKPHYVILGLSYATDFYDLLPADHGGWIYGGDKTRDYFDFGSNGKLELRHWTKPSDASSSVNDSGISSSAPQVLRRLLDHSATFRFLRRSNLALSIGSKLRINGQSLWPNMEIVVEKDPSPQHKYQHDLFRALLLEINSECTRQNAKLIVVGIPYLPQIYDELWSSTYGGNDRYSRTAAIERVSSICSTNQITYIDTLDAMRSKTQQLGKWLHHRKDAHPTADGQKVISETVLSANILRPKNP